MANRATYLLLASLLGVFSLGAHGASLVDVPPGVIAQLKTMPPAQARALAEQYGST